MGPGKFDLIYERFKIGRQQTQISMRVKPLKVIRTTELKEILVISCWQKTFFWQSFWYHLLSLYALCEIKDAFSRVVTWTLAIIYQCDLKFRIPFENYFYVHTNSLVKANLFYANFTNTTFQKIPIPHLTRTMKQKFLDLYLICLTEIRLTQLQDQK